MHHTCALDQKPMITQPNIGINLVEQPRIQFLHLPLEAGQQHPHTSWQEVHPLQRTSCHTR